MCVFIPVLAAITTFVIRTIVTCELLAGFFRRCPDVCPLDCTVWRVARARAEFKGGLADWYHLHYSGWRECKRHFPRQITRSLSRPVNPT